MIEYVRELDSEEDRLMQEMMKYQEETPDTFQKTEKNFPEAEVVIAEFPVTSTELHKIANGDCCQFNSRESLFSIRFLLKDSHKSYKSNFVINNYVIQIIASNKDHYLKKEEIAVKTKVVKTETKRQPQTESVKIDTQIQTTGETLF